MKWKLSANAGFFGLRRDRFVQYQPSRTLEEKFALVARVRGVVGVRMQSLEASATRIEDEVLQVKDLLSEVRDLDYAAAVSRFQTLQTTFEASLQTAANILPLTLLDFLS